MVCVNHIMVCMYHETILTELCGPNVSLKISQRCQTQLGYLAKYSQLILF